MAKLEKSTLSKGERLGEGAFVGTPAAGLVLWSNLVDYGGRDLRRHASATSHICSPRSLTASVPPQTEWSGVLKTPSRRTDGPVIISRCCGAFDFQPFDRLQSLG
ncbi:hypothetical protein EYF80_058315 [Liparis tanakae]|uniref:Uncharacterized protein n=1 Tax=Liparis tanakae TaxID=230148 RepID=A0A4Z2ERX3_9TELE|nr:hypothetical protein EYF80_058315 [Liparis tanakae]